MGKSTALTDTECRRAKYQPGAGNKWFDGGGLYLEAKPSGSRKWRLKYRFNGKENRLTFGDYPSLTLLEARQKRETAKRLLRDGIDPMIDVDARSVCRWLCGGDSFQHSARRSSSDERADR